MQSHDIVERPGWRGFRQRCRPVLGAAPEFGDHCLQSARQFVQANMQVRFERCKASLGPLEFGHRTGGRGADLTEIRGLLAELLDRFLVQLTQRAQLVLHRLLELLNPLIGVVPEPRLDGVPVAESRLHLSDRLRVTLIGGRPSIQDVTALLDQLRQPRLHRLKMFLRLLPLMKGQAESIQLRFEFGKTLFEVRTLLMHHSPCARDVTQLGTRRSTLSRGRRPSDPRDDRFPHGPLAS